MTHHDELTPLSVLLRVMHAKWKEGDWDGAVAIARTAAPYLHPRHGSARHQANADPEYRHLSDADLAERLAETRTRVFGQKPNSKQPVGMGK
jgi:hypothetical protein